MWNEDQQQHLHKNLPAGLWSTCLGGRSQIVPCVLYIWPRSPVPALSEGAAFNANTSSVWILENTDSLTSLFLALSHDTVDLKTNCWEWKLKNTNESRTNVRRAGLRGRNLDTPVCSSVQKYPSRASYHQTARSAKSSSRIPDVQYHSILQKFSKRSLFQTSSKPGIS